MNGGTVTIKYEADSKDLDKETEGLSKKFDGIGSKIGSAVLKGTAVAGAGLSALTGASVKAYADMEQNIGGVETLFKASETDIKNYAEIYGMTVDEVKANNDLMNSSINNTLANSKEAYKTAGISANKYMEIVTGFSASLLQSLGGDTQKASDYADRAIIDMADNSNKMGTSMELIQNAYQGFAKQNYTMLDNLKLG